MAQAALAVTSFHSAFPPPANDNDRGPGDTDGDRWHWLIERFKAIDMSFAVYAAKQRLMGVNCEVFCIRFLRGAKLAGWEGLEDWGG